MPSRIPYGEGNIVSWDRAYCKKCQKQFKSRESLHLHLIRSKAHNKKLIAKYKKIEKQRKKQELKEKKILKARIKYWNSLIHSEKTTA
jgi:hypothetical protein